MAVLFFCITIFLILKNFCIVVTVSDFLKSFMLEDLKELSKYYQLTIISSDAINFSQVYNIDCFTKQIYISRKINLLYDIKALWLLMGFFSKNRFDIVLSVTPKAGLLAMLSAFLLRIPKRIHFFTGQVWVNKLGFWRFFLKNIDKLIATLTTNILVAGKAQRQFLIQQKVISAQKSQTLFHGVDTQKFSQDLITKQQLKQKYGLDDNDLVFMFLGRINKDKGIVELLEVMRYLLPKYPHLRFFMVGHNEADIPTNLLVDFAKLPQVFVLPSTKQPEQLLNLADVLVLPSHREGCAHTPFEAAAMKIPTISSDIYGLADSVIDGKTGLIHRVRDKEDMKEKYQQLIVDRNLRISLGNQAYQRVIDKFNKQKTTQVFIEYFVNANVS